MNYNLRTYILLLTLTLDIAAWGQNYRRITNLPHIYIETENELSITSKTEYIMARMIRVTADDKIEIYDSLSIRGRGNSTWKMSKKPYKIKFNKKEKFLGKGYANAKKWTLIANHGDKTMLRNALTFRLGEWMGIKNCPAHEFVDLTINSWYVGTYMVSDHIEVKPHRVNVEEQDYPLTDTSDISGGYMFEFDGFQDGNGFITSHTNQYVRVHYPDEDEIEKAQMVYAINYFDEIESRLYGRNFKDPELGYRPMVDSTSLVNWYLATEISANPDGFYSTYCYKHRGDDRLYWGPLWDYDITYGNDNRVGDTRQTMMRTSAFRYTQAWVGRMWQDDWFKNVVCRRYYELQQAGLDSFMLATVDSLAEVISWSKELNFEIWGINRRAYNECVLYSTYEQYLNDLRTFIPAHNAYLAKQFPYTAPEPPDGIKDYGVDYALAYNPTTHELHFGSDATLDFTVRVYNTGGQCVGVFRANERFSMQNMSAGTYIVTWTYAGRHHSIKFRHSSSL